jgi:hypothetical protein
MILAVPQTIGAGTLVATYAVIGQLGPDGVVELAQIDLDTDGIGWACTDVVGQAVGHETRSPRTLCAMGAVGRAVGAASDARL